MGFMSAGCHDMCNFEKGDNMKPLDEIYKPGFYKRRDSLSWRAPLVCDPVINILAPESVIDVGCAIGDLVEYFIAEGLDAYGLEGTENVVPWLKISRERLFIGDLRTKIRLQRRFDLAICFEVLEHIEPEYVDILLDNLTGMSDILLLSAAGPGQGGHYHVNCQFNDYWIAKLSRAGYAYDATIVSRIRTEWEPVSHKKEMSSYFSNLMFFKKGGDHD